MLSALEQIRLLYSKLIDGDKEILEIIKAEVGDNLIAYECIKLLQALASVLSEVEEDVFDAELLL